MEAYIHELCALSLEDATYEVYSLLMGLSCEEETIQADACSAGSTAMAAMLGESHVDDASVQWLIDKLVGELKARALRRISTL